MLIFGLLFLGQIRLNNPQKSSKNQSNRILKRTETDEFIIKSNLPSTQLPK